MRIVSSLFLIALLQPCISQKSQHIKITASDPDYRDAHLVFSIPGNPFLDSPAGSTRVSFDSTGLLSKDFPLKEAGVVHLQTGIYDGSIYAEPGKEYEIKLPPFRRPRVADLLSPYFEYKKITLKVIRPAGDLNSSLLRLDSVFIQMNDLVIYSRQHGINISADSLINALDEQFAMENSPWIRAQVKYKEGILKINEGKTGLEEIRRKYLGEKVWEKNPGYMELSRLMFKDFLIYYSRTREGAAIRNMINRTQDLFGLRAVLLAHPAISTDTLADLVLLQELPSMFYEGSYHKHAILMLLDSMQAHPSKPSFAAYAGEIKSKLANLLIGNRPPEFNLKDPEGKSWTLSDFKGKYVYLMFCTPDHYGCMMEYPFLNTFVAKHNSYLEVITVMVTENESSLKDFMKRNDYIWKALSFGGNTQVLDEYQVRAFPVAYLIGPDGRLILSPAVLPSEGFEQQLFRIMRSRGDI